ncbi:cytochrome P450 [Hypericibacter terrae]|uniref:Cytochrome P450 n=1 Tax=Hypericibacter terrae TaxID=2602015 RepID=A0A5J6MH94_9PROT|nr:cytochrome P450 [Hypericibacter terrae]QEX16461.1 cytochrome P450 [Hypericibacter terrae]
MTSFKPTDDGHADLSDHDAFLEGAPHNTFARMRREDPLAWSEMKGAKGFWSITRHQDVLDLNRSFELLSSARGIRMEDQTYEEYLARRTFQETDPPEHSRTRVLVSKAFSKPVVALFEEQIRLICDSILDDVMERRSFEAVKDVARQLPMRMLGQILGTPEADLDWLVEKGDQLIANTDPEFTEHVLDKADTDAYRFMPFRSPAGADLYDYAKKLMEDKQRRGDTSGVLHLILQPDAHGNVISELEFRNFFCLLVAAGNDTTRYSIAASLYALANRPELMKQLQAGEGNIWETAPDEFIRWASPTMHFRRTATRDFEMHGKTVKAGDKVILWFVSANRDEQTFENPFELNLLRTPNRHVAFGQGGPHVCLGMWLARLEVRILLQEMVKRMTRIEQTGPHEYLRSNFIGGIKRLPVRIALH